MQLTKEIEDRIEKLQTKYAAMGQDMSSYLDGLLHADYLTYWDYIHLETLLSLQTPRTRFPDEKIFITYHQITELYFKLVLLEQEQLLGTPPSATFFIERIKRINNYFDNLVASFSIMVDGMDKEQFLKYRMSLLPASGFQSAQYRMIELMSTSFINLVHVSMRDKLRTERLTEQFEHIYWKQGATELATGDKTLTLKQFELKYEESLFEIALSAQTKNIWLVFSGITFTSVEEKNTAIQLLRYMDQSININWRLAHYKSAVRYLQRNPDTIKATGGTNWQEYLPPRFQKVIFFPELWTAAEHAEWGKSWVDQHIS